MLTTHCIDTILAQFIILLLSLIVLCFQLSPINNGFINTTTLKLLPSLVQFSTVLYFLLGKWVYYLKDKTTSIAYCISTILLMPAYITTHYATRGLIDPFVYMPSIFTIALMVYIFKDFYNYYFIKIDENTPPNTHCFDYVFANIMMIFLAIDVLIMDVYIVTNDFKCTPDVCIDDAGNFNNFYSSFPLIIQIITVVHFIVGKWAYYLMNVTTSIIFAVCTILLIPGYILTHIGARDPLLYIPSIFTIALTVYIFKDFYNYFVNKMNEINENIQIVRNS